MGLFDKKKNDLELHIVCNTGADLQQEKLIHLFGLYQKYYDTEQQSPESLAIDLINEAILERIERAERINQAKQNLQRREPEWEGKADIASFTDFYAIMQSTDPMIQKLSQGKSVYLEGYVYQIWNCRNSNAHSFDLVPFPCSSDYTRSDIEYLLRRSEIRKIKVNAPNDLLWSMKKGDQIQLEGQITTLQYITPDHLFIDAPGVNLAKIKLPDLPLATMPIGDPSFQIDWQRLKAEEKEKKDADWEDFVKEFQNNP